MIDVNKLYDATNGGADLFKFYFPDFDPGKSSNLVKVRDDDDHPSASIFQKGGKWMIKDHGGGDNKARSMIDFVMEREHLEFKEAVAFIDRACQTNLAASEGEKRTYPTDYILIGTQSEQKKYIGNAVEVNMAKALVETLAKCIRA